MPGTTYLGIVSTSLMGLRIPTGREIAAARTLAGLHQQDLAERAGLNVGTVSRMELSGADLARGHASNVQRVLDSLREAGVEITETGIRLIEGKPKRR
jgi:transcriptional regulator with XRE-family HTH domain